MKVDPNRLRLLLTCLALALIAGGGLWFHQGVISTKAAELETLQRQHERQQQRSHLLYALDRQVRQMRGQASSLASRIPERSNVGAFLEDLSRHLEGHAARDIQVRKGEPREAGSFQRVPVEVRFSGTWRAVWAALVRIEQYGQGIRPTGVSIDRQPPLADELSVHVELVALSHARKEAGR